MWNLKSVQVIPISVDALGALTRKLGECWETGHYTPNSIPTKTALLGTARILTKELET